MSTTFGRKQTQAHNTTCTTGWKKWQIWAVEFLSFWSMISHSPYFNHTKVRMGMRTNYIEWSSPSADEVWFSRRSADPMGGGGEGGEEGGWVGLLTDTVRYLGVTKALGAPQHILQYTAHQTPSPNNRARWHIPLLKLIIRFLRLL